MVRDGPRAGYGVSKAGSPVHRAPVTEVSSLQCPVEETSMRFTNCEFYWMKHTIFPSPTLGQLLPRAGLTLKDRREMARGCAFCGAEQNSET